MLNRGHDPVAGRRHFLLSHMRAAPRHILVIKDYEILQLGHHWDEALEQYERMPCALYTEVIARRLGPRPA